jgi:hypothetical protein
MFSATDRPGVSQRSGVSRIGLHTIATHGRKSPDLISRQMRMCDAGSLEMPKAASQVRTPE